MIKKEKLYHECLALRKIPYVQHAFFTKKGGFSSNEYATLNCGLNTHDDPANVTKNRHVVSNHFNIHHSRLLTAQQIHSDKAEIITEPFLISNLPKIDGMVTNKEKLLLGILTADCAPILLADRLQPIIGACHAGWRGALTGVIENTILKMLKLGSQRHHIVATVGPCISHTEYEVGYDFYETLNKESKRNSKFFYKKKQNDAMFFHLRAYVEHKLKEQGIILISHINDSQNSYSYRQLNETGRQISVIMINHNEPSVNL